jgi:hypothetical protein
MHEMGTDSAHFQAVKAKHHISTHLPSDGKIAVVSLGAWAAKSVDATLNPLQFV